MMQVTAFAYSNSTTTMLVLLIMHYTREKCQLKVQMGQNCLARGLEVWCGVVWCDRQEESQVEAGLDFCIHKALSIQLLGFARDKEFLIHGAYDAKFFLPSKTLEEIQQQLMMVASSIFWCLLILVWCIFKPRRHNMSIAR